MRQQLASAYRDNALGLLRATPLAPGRVRQTTLPPDVRALSTLARVDYEDAFLADVDSVRDRTAEQWARAALESAPIMMREALPWGWAALGLQLGSTRSDRVVHGWELRRNTADVALLGRGGRLGLVGELVFKRHQGALLFATLVELQNPAARAVWAGIGAWHRQVVRYLLEQTVARHGDEGGPG